MRRALQGTAMTPQAFRDWRKQHSLTQDAAADILGVTTRAVAKWEAGGAPSRN